VAALTAPHSKLQHAAHTRAAASAALLQRETVHARYAERARALLASAATRYRLRFSLELWEHQVIPDRAASGLAIRCKNAAKCCAHLCARDLTMTIRTAACRRGASLHCPPAARSAPGSALYLRLPLRLWCSARCAPPPLPCTD
jgi:hypothetical protein